MTEPLMTDGTERSGLSQGTVEAIVRERLALIERVRQLEGALRDARVYLTTPQAVGVSFIDEAVRSIDAALAPEQAP